MIGKCLALLVVSSVLCMAYGQEAPESTSDVDRTKRQVPLVPQIIEIIEPNPYLNPLLLGRKKRAVTEDIELDQTKTRVTEEISRNKRQIPMVPQIIEIIEPNPYLNPLLLGRKKRQVELLEQPELVEFLPNPLNPVELGRKKRQIPMVPQIIEIIEPNPYLNPLLLGRKKRAVTEDIELDQTKTRVTEEISRNKRQIPMVPQIIEIIEPNPYLNPLALGRRKRQVPMVPQIIEIIEPSPYLNPLLLGRKKRQVELLEQPELVEFLPNPLNPVELGRKKRQIPMVPQIIEIIEPNPYLNPLVL